MSEGAKPVIVRVKRKPTQEPIAAFWLEINDRPLKRQMLNFSSLTISDSASEDVVRTKKVLVQHVETINDSEAAKDVLQSLLSNYAAPERWKKCIEDRRHMLRKAGKKHEQLHSLDIQKHESLARNARFEQIWQKRRSKPMNNALLEGCQVYEFARIDGEDEIVDKEQASGGHTVEDNAMLHNYLSLLRECIPSAAAEIEADLVSRQGGYVYDIYTMEDMEGSKETTFAEYPLVPVNDIRDYYDGASDFEYDSEDSNADRSELHDYPDEEGSEESQEDGDEEERFDYLRKSESESESEYEGIVEGDEKEMENLKWRFRHSI